MFGSSFFRPYGTLSEDDGFPTACAVGFILAPLRGWLGGIVSLRGSTAELGGVVSVARVRCAGLAEVTSRR